MVNLINITINEKPQEIEEGTSVTSLLAKIKNERAAVWINGRQLLRKEYDSHILMPGDTVKVLRIIAGG